jgi:hypothetical protein
MQVTPPTFRINVMRGTSTNNFTFKDQDTAERVAKPLTHAAKLCGGLAPQPF